jgi:uncharacterized protein
VLKVQAEDGWHDASGNSFHSYRNENQGIEGTRSDGVRFGYINDLAIKEFERKYHWPLGRRPDGHDLGL